VDAFSKFLIRHPKAGRRVLALNQDGQELLSAGRTKQAERRFSEAVRLCECAVPALNNLALCAYLRGNLRRAVQTAHRVLEYHPENIFAHCTLAESHMKLGQTEKAQIQMDRALALLEDPASLAPLEKLNKVIEALAALEQDDTICSLYQALRDEEDIEEILDATSWFYIGVAAANLGHLGEARAIWRRADEGDPLLKPATLYSTAARLIEEGKAPSIRFCYAFEVRNEPDQLDPAHPPGRLKPLVIEAIWEGKEDVRRAMVKLLAQWEDPWAEDILHLLLTQPELPDDLKTQAASALIDRGTLTEDEKVEMHLGGQYRTVVMQRREIPNEPPPEAVKQFEQGVKHKERGDLARAEKAYRKALELAPYLAPAMVNLANICRVTERLDEAEQLLKGAIDFDESPTALLNLASLSIQRGDYEGAAAPLSRVSSDDLEEENLSLFYHIQGYLHLHRGDFTSAKAAFQRLIELDPKNEEATKLLVRGENMGNWQARRRVYWEKRRRRYRSQPVDLQTPLVTALLTLTKENHLTAMARWHHIPFISALRKKELAERIASVLKENVTEAWTRLSPEAKRALRWLVANAGKASLATLTERFGSIDEDSINWYYEEPDSVVGELQLAGFVFLGADEHGETVGLIPAELAKLLPLQR